MEKNAVISIIEKIVGTDKIEYISGEIQNCGTKHCKLSEIRGAVYGIAIKLERSQKSSFFCDIEEDLRNNTKEQEWISIGDDYYPLYWGKDKNMGLRLHAHTKTMKSTGTLQLNSNTMSFLKDKEIIYGAIPCMNYEKNEEKLHKRYPDILKTKSGDKDELSIPDMCDE